MPAGRPRMYCITLTPEEGRTLKRWSRRHTLLLEPDRLARRALFILALAAHASVSRAAQVAGIARPKVYRWVHRFLEEGPRGLVDKPHPPPRRRPLPRRAE